jgi:uncharacterized protein (TIGR02118 family)
MIVVSVLYPNTPGSKFDRDYYLATHTPLLKQRWSPMGMQSVQLLSAVATPDGSPPVYQVIALLTFASLEAFQQAAAAHAREIMGDIKNFTDVKPVVQINEEFG